MKLYLWSGHKTSRNRSKPIKSCAFLFNVKFVYPARWRLFTTPDTPWFCQGFTYVESMWNLWMWIQKGFWSIVQYRKTARRYRLCFGEAECPTSWLIFTENTLISAKNSGSYVNDLRIIMRNHRKTSPFFWKLATKYLQFNWEYTIEGSFE